MSNAEESWYFTQNGERKGPVSMDLLSSLVEKGKLDPESDLVWGPGLTDWTKAGELDALKPAYLAVEEAKAAEATAAPEQVVPAPAPSPAPVAVEPEVDTPPPPPQQVPVPTPVLEQKNTEPVSAADENEILAEAMEERRQQRELNRGLSRGKFIGGSFGLHIIGLIIITVVYSQLFANLGGDLEQALDMESAEVQKSALSAGLIANIVSLVMTLVTFLMVLSRLVNLGMSRWNILWGIVPVASIWLGYRLVVCPAGYANHKKLDGAGKGLAFLYFAAMLLPFLFIGALSFAMSSGALGDGTELQELLKQLQEIEKLKQSPLPNQ